MRFYTVKENLVGSAVSEIIRYTQTDKHPVSVIIRLNTTLYWNDEIVSLKTSQTDISQSPNQNMKKFEHCI